MPPADRGRGTTVETTVYRLKSKQRATTAGDCSTEPTYNGDCDARLAAKPARRLQLWRRCYGDVSAAWSVGRSLEWSGRLRWLPLTVGAVIRIPFETEVLQRLGNDDSARDMLSRYKEYSNVAVSIFLLSSVRY